MEKVVIIGSGCAGLTSAIYTARANLEPLVLTGAMPGGLLTTTSIVENFPGFSKGIDGTELMVEMQQQAERFGAKIQFGSTVEAIDFSGQPLKLTVDGKEVETQTVIIASGAGHRHLGLESEAKLEKKGVTYCATCDGALPMFRDQPLVVVGGGDSACEEATYLTRFASKVYLVHRRDELRASKIMAERTLANDKAPSAPLSPKATNASRARKRLLASKNGARSKTWTWTRACEKSTACFAKKDSAKGKGCRTPRWPAHSVPPLNFSPWRSASRH